MWFYLLQRRLDKHLGAWKHFCKSHLTWQIIKWCDSPAVSSLSQQTINVCVWPASSQKLYNIPDILIYIQFLLVNVYRSCWFFYRRKICILFGHVSSIELQLAKQSSLYWPTGNNKVRVYSLQNRFQFRLSAFSKRKENLTSHNCCFSCALRKRRFLCWWDLFERLSDVKVVQKN